MKGMTNALPVLIDASTLATKSDISDMETKTNANATFATKTALTTLQNATKVAVENFAITESADKVTITTTAIDGATSKSEDIPAVTDTTAGIVTPALKKKWDSSGSGEWLAFNTLNDIDKSKLKIGSQIMVKTLGYLDGSYITGAILTCNSIETVENYTEYTFYGCGYGVPADGNYYTLVNVQISNPKSYGANIEFRYNYLKDQKVITRESGVGYGENTYIKY